MPVEHSCSVSLLIPKFSSVVYLMNTFLIGLVGGTIWHSIGGARNAPSGQRMSQAFSRVKARVPILGGTFDLCLSGVVQHPIHSIVFTGSFAVWGVLFSGFDCTLVHFRKKVSYVSSTVVFRLC